jgi:hypothetical protein
VGQVSFARFDRVGEDEERKSTKKVKNKNKKRGSHLQPLDVLSAEQDLRMILPICPKAMLYFGEALQLLFDSDDDFVEQRTGCRGEMFGS